MKKFKIDPVHSNIGFQVRHMMLAKVNGRFNEYDARVEMPDAYFEEAKLHFTALTSSINTHNPERDAHLRSGDFFNTALYKHIYFHSTQIKRIKENTYNVVGLLKMNGIENPVQLRAVYLERRDKDTGEITIALQMEGKIDRMNWNMKWNRPLESGGILVSKEVKLQIESEFNLVL